MIVLLLEIARISSLRLSLAIDVHTRNFQLRTGCRALRCIRRLVPRKCRSKLEDTGKRSAALAGLHRLDRFNGTPLGFDQMKSRRWHTDMNVRAGRYARHLTAKSAKWNPRSAQICDQASALTALR